MNSWGNDSLERRIDELLGSSVSPGSEPGTVHLTAFPSKPVFPWNVMMYAALAVVAVGGLLARWIIGLKLETVEYGHVLPGLEKMGRFVSEPGSVEAVSAAAIVAGIAGIIMVLLSFRRISLLKLF